MEPEQIPGVENGLIWAQTFDQGEFPHCTLYAISNAICDYGRKVHCRLQFDEIQRTLFQYLKTCMPVGVHDGWYPDEFDGIHLPLVSLGNETDDYGNITISVTQGCPSTYIFEEEYVLVDRREPQDHCMQVICKMKMDDIKYFLCRDNRAVGPKEGGQNRRGRYDSITTDKTEKENGLHIVRICVHTEFVPPHSPDTDIEMAFGSSPFPASPVLSSSVPFNDPKHVPNVPSPWKETYVPKTLQCISLAISEYCKNIGFYVPPDDVRKAIIDEYAYTNKIEKISDIESNPEELNNTKLCKGLLIPKHSDELQHFFGSESLDIEVKIEKTTPNSLYIFSNEYVLREKDRGTCNLVVCRSEEEGYDCVDGKHEQDYFMCSDISIVVGPKSKRFGKGYLDDNKNALFKVRVNEVQDILQEEEWTVEDDFVEVFEDMDLN